MLVRGVYMKKTVNIFMTMLVLVTQFMPMTIMAVGESEKKNPDSYWSEKNAPIFYGATKITLELGSVEKFDVLDTRFRIFAKDFEDGDLTSKIKHTGEVNVQKEGTYEITYTVSDSHGNQSKMVVPVVVTAPASNETPKINVERTLYTTPSVWNMDLVGTRRCNYGDRQILGVYLPANTKIRARILSASNNIAIRFLANDSAVEGNGVTLSTNGSWAEIQNIKNDVSYDSVPLFTTSVMGKGVPLNTVFKVELEYTSTIPELNYYHQNDDEKAFREQWTADKNTYGVIENEVLTAVVPFADLNKLTNYYKNGFKSLDQFCEYWKKVVDRMDALIGLSLNPENVLDQNVRTKYLVRANIHGGGAAYYASDHVGIHNASIAAFFEMNWGGLHEFAHGYQGTFGKGAMSLGEVSNNILGRYIQTDKSIYFHPGDWLGNMASIETSKNQERLDGKTFVETQVSTRLYALINLFDSLEGGETYAKMFQWYRRAINEGKQMTNQDAYVLSIADLYGVNIIPYMEAWKLNISDSVKSSVYEKNYPMYSILKDTVTDSNVDKVLKGEGTNRKFALVTNEVLQKYQIKSNLTINIDINDINDIKGQYIFVKNGNQVIKKVKVESKTVTIPDCPVGTYYVQMPTNYKYQQNYFYATVKDGVENTYQYTYTLLQNLNYNNSYYFQLVGPNNTHGYRLTFKDNFKKATISLNGARLYAGESYVIIKDAKGNIISEERKNYDAGNGIYFNFPKGSYDVDLGVGYTIEVYHPNKANIQWYSTLTNERVMNYTPSKETTIYTITENGIKMENMTDEDVSNLSYEFLKKTLVKTIEDYKNKVTDEELNNKFINFRGKQTVLGAYNQLKKEDQTEYQQLISRIKRGGVPTIQYVGKSSYDANEKIELYQLIEVSDNEDGVITASKNNTKVITSLDMNKAGSYDVLYQVTDSDGNMTSSKLKITITKEEEPVEPTPETPNVPEQPVNPAPEVPSTPDKPDIPETPSVPEQPVDPTPEVPSVSETPSEPVTPNTSNGSTTDSKKPSTTQKEPTKDTPSGNASSNNTTSKQNTPSSNNNVTSSESKHPEENREEIVIPEEKPEEIENEPEEKEEVKEEMTSLEKYEKKEKTIALLGIGITLLLIIGVYITGRKM